MALDSRSTLNVIAQTLYDKKGWNILVLDLRGISTLTDYCIIAEGNIDRHIVALGQAVREKLYECGWKPLHVEGEKGGDWLIVDYGDIMLHLFTADMRERYALEELWKSSKIVDVKINVTERSR